MEFSDLGAHCEVCNLRDFLPFECDCCGKAFCLEHRTYSAHQCPKAGLKDTVAIKCPICKESLVARASDDLNEVWNSHYMAKGCDVSQRKKKPRCAAKGCKQMGPSNKETCGTCRQDVCFAHRYPDAHKCPGPATRASWLSWGGGGGGGITTTTTRSTTSSKAASRINTTKARAAATKGASHDPRNTLKGSADRRRRANSKVAREGATAVAVAVPPPSISSSEVIDLSGDDDPSSVPSSLSSTLGPGNQPDGGCPLCHFISDDPVRLVNHVETVHRGQQQEGQQQGSTCLVG